MPVQTSVWVQPVPQRPSVSHVINTAEATLIDTQSKKAVEYVAVWMGGDPHREDDKTLQFTSHVVPWGM